MPDAAAHAQSQSPFLDSRILFLRFSLLLLMTAFQGDGAHMGSLLRS